MFETHPSISSTLFVAATAPSKKIHCPQKRSWQRVVPHFQCPRSSSTHQQTRKIEKTNEVVSLVKGLNCPLFLKNSFSPVSDLHKSSETWPISYTKCVGSLIAAPRFAIGWVSLTCTCDGCFSARCLISKSLMSSTLKTWELNYQCEGTIR